ncbi:MAG: hypothetical protein KatS3mg019_1692 [Fimbriimonadales bacterium]|nr:MAG: hypothetical protein KatS3mg019_1692 [Fimbriimonadales bacterium]
MLAIANLMAMPHTVAALNELRGGGANVPAMRNSGGCSQQVRLLSPNEVKRFLSTSVQPYPSALQED